TDTTLDNNTSTNHEPWTVTADANGGFTTVWNIPANEDELGATLDATATGLTSGLMAQTSFTDAAATVTPGNATASADTAGTLTFVTITPSIIIAETSAANFNRNTSYVLTFSPPSGWVFDTGGTPPSVIKSSPSDIVTGPTISVVNSTQI